MTCTNREWLDSDEAMASGPLCGEPATHYSCNNYGPNPTGLNACKKHKCRCAPRVAPVVEASTSDTFFRKAQTLLPGGAILEREWNASERYQLFARGYRDGAGTKPMRKDHMGLGPYDRGYAAGVAATRAACDEEAKRLGYEPSILRAADT